MISLVETKRVLSESQENYLKQIFLLTEDAKSAGTQALADKLRVAPASVTVMVQKLKELDLVTYEHYQGVQLSEQGRLVALELLRHHRLLESFLQRALGYGWEEVHDEAEKLEHYISETFEHKIAEWLGHPSFDPHGDPIPDAQLRLPDSAPGTALSCLEPKTKGVLSRVATQDRDELNLFLHLHLVPGTLVEVIEKLPGSLRLRTLGPKARPDADQFLLPDTLAERLFLIQETL